MSDVPVAGSRRAWAIRLNRSVYWLSRHWYLSISVLIGIYVGLPWLAPVFMWLGWETAGNAIYSLYGTQCHQMPQRSFFLFGSQPMISLEEVQAIWQRTNNPIILRQFVGTGSIGWKVAWSDRMVFMYSTILIWGLIYWPFRKRIKPLPWSVFALFLLPLAADGITHVISDFTGGVGYGFRYNNEWLATLTGSVFSDSFYSGDSLGSFNSWMRFASGFFFSLAVVWAFYPRLQSSFAQKARQIENKFHQSGIKI